MIALDSSTKLDSYLDRPRQLLDQLLDRNPPDSMRLRRQGQWSRCQARQLDSSADRPRQTSTRSTSKRWDLVLAERARVRAP